jgi:hypothetical protein
MRGVLLILAGFSLFAALPAAATPILEDAAGDVAAASPPVVAPSGSRDYADLIGLDVQESEAGFRFNLAFQGAEPGNLHSYADVTVGFRHAGTEFQVAIRGNDMVFGTVQGILGQEGAGHLFRRPVGQVEWREVEGTVPIDFALAVATWSFDLPRSSLVDEDGVEPRPGRALEDFWALAIDQQCAVSPCVESGFSDLMPDQGLGTTPFPVTMGETVVGPLLLRSPRPTQSSNGEEGLFVFDVSLSSSQASTLAVELQADGTPNGWAVEFPVPAVEIEEGQTVNVPVVVSVPFRHQHGVKETLTVSARDLTSHQALTSLDLGINYLEVPQPAGHHPTVWLHAGYPAFAPIPGSRLGAGYQPEAYFNTLDEDASDSGSEIGPRLADPPVNPSVYTWCIPLNPALSLGIDLDQLQTGTFTARLGAGTFAEGTFSGRVLAVGGWPDFQDSTACDDQPALTLATVSPADVAIGIDQSVPIEAAVEPVQDLLPDRDGQNLLIEFEFEVSQPVPRKNDDHPFFEPGASLRLPLKEYHDAEPIELGQQLMTLQSEGRLIRNPGSAAVFNLSTVGDAADFSFGVLGTRPEWARIVESEGMPNLVHVVVEVPPEAATGEIADLLIRASRGDESSFIRVVVETDTASTHPDDRSLVEALGEDRSAPLNWIVVPSGILLALGVRRLR